MQVKIIDLNGYYGELYWGVVRGCNPKLDHRVPLNLTHESFKGVQATEDFSVTKLEEAQMISLKSACQ